MSHGLSCVIQYRLLSNFKVLIDFEKKVQILETRNIDAHSNHAF